MSYKDVPNAITVSRLILTPPVFVLAFWITASPDIHLLVVAAAIILAASDTLDGQLARKWNCTSKFGEKWDPIADKLAVVLYLPLVWFQMIHIIPVLFIFLRDALSSGLRLWINRAVPARVSGKIKTVVNLVLMCVLFAAVPVKGGYLPLVSDLRELLYWFSGITITVICLWSGWDYVHAIALRSRE
jgi:CDP-diacylglycerol--glycerol-3-phosphate 3-phosphatidyltransferase